MGFWTGVAKGFGLRPINSFGDFVHDVTSFGALGTVRNLADNLIDEKVSTTMDGTLDAINTLREGGLGDYVGDLFQTDADAALDQAMTNDALSEAAWLRSEKSADAAQARARELRQTYYSDLMRSLKSAGLNPVLAASGGFGGVSSSAPMGTSQAATSQKADALNAADLIEAIAAVLTGAGSLARGVSSFLPSTVIRK